MAMSLSGPHQKMLENKSNLLKALAHPIRLCIVRNLVESGGCNVSKMQTCLTMPQSTISQHLSKLKACGIVEGKRCGTEITYFVIHPDAVSIAKTLIPDIPDYDSTVS